MFFKQPVPLVLFGKAPQFPFPLTPGLKIHRKRWSCSTIPHSLLIPRAHAQFEVRFAWCLAGASSASNYVFRLRAMCITRFIAFTNTDQHQRPDSKFNPYVHSEFVQDALDTYGIPQDAIPTQCAYVKQAHAQPKLTLVHVFRVVGSWEL